MIAALCVFLHHFAGWGYPRVGQDTRQAIITEGHVGVTSVFVLSGFLMTLRYLDSFEQGNFSLSNYIIKRVARIYPLYYTVLALTLLLNHQALFTSHTLAYWTLQQGYFTTLRFSGIPTAWSVTVEEAF